MSSLKKITFDDFCHTYLDGLYDPTCGDYQCTGYYALKEMCMKNIKPASLEEIERWENNPTQEELMSMPHLKYMRSIHPHFRSVIIGNWDFIRNLLIKEQLGEFLKSK